MITFIALLLWFVVGAAASILIMLNDSEAREWHELSGRQKWVFGLLIGPVGWLVSLLIALWQKP